MELTPGMSKLAAYWSTIQAAVEGGLNTAQLWSAVQNAAVAEMGAPLKGVSVVDMSRMRALAAANRTAANNFEAAAAHVGIDATMIGRTLYAKDIGIADEPRDWMVRFQHTYLVDGEQETTWRSTVFRGFLPTTKQDLLDQLAQDGEQMSLDYSVTHVGVGSAQIMAA